MIGVVLFLILLLTVAVAVLCRVDGGGMLEAEQEARVEAVARTAACVAAVQLPEEIALQVFIAVGAGNEQLPQRRRFGQRLVAQRADKERHVVP